MTLHAGRHHYSESTIIAGVPGSYDGFRDIQPVFLLSGMQFQTSTGNTAWQQDIFTDENGITSFASPSSINEATYRVMANPHGYKLDSILDSCYLSSSWTWYNNVLLKGTPAVFGRFDSADRSFILYDVLWSFRKVVPRRISAAMSKMGYLHCVATLLRDPEHAFHRIVPCAAGVYPASGWRELYEESEMFQNREITECSVIVGKDNRPMMVFIDRGIFYWHKFGQDTHGERWYPEG